MAFVQATTGQGGWPMSVWLTPDLKPFYGGTYFPPTARWGRPGFVDLLREIARVWREERPAGARRVRAWSSIGSRVPGRTTRDCRGRDPVGDPGPRRARRRRRRFARTFDRALRRVRRRAEVSASVRAAPAAARVGRRRAATTLRDMVGRDARGRWPRAACAITSAAASIATRSTSAGACRTSRRCSTTRRSWSSRCIEASQAAADPLLRRGRRRHAGLRRSRAVRRRRRLLLGRGRRQHPARSAAGDSREPGAHASEGAFYIWPQREIDDAARRGRRARRALRFGIEPNGNAPFDPQQEFTGKNLLYTATTFDDIAAACRPAGRRRRRRRRPGPGRCCSRRATAAASDRSTTRC